MPLFDVEYLRKGHGHYKLSPGPAPVASPTCCQRAAKVQRLQIISMH